MQYEQGYGDAAQQGPGAPQANGRQGYGYQPDYGAEQPGYGQQQGYSAQQSYCEQVVWSVGKGAGVTGLVDSQTALRDITTQQSVYMQDVRLLPHILRGGEALVLSRWNMQRPKPTVSREQCKVVVAADGTAALISCGRGSTLWRQSDSPWYAVSRSDTCPLAHGDQISLDCNDPDAAVFTCTCELSSSSSAAAALQDYEQANTQQAYAEEYARQGYLFVSQVDLPAGWTTCDDQVSAPIPSLPAGWAAAVDEASGVTYYHCAATGHSQWEPPSYT